MFSKRYSDGKVIIEIMY